MKPLDILLVTRRFWPHSGLTELALSSLARNIKEAGHNITVATVRWSRGWSENVNYHEIPVVRFARPVNGPWSSYRYARALARHFAIKTYDGIIVSGLGDEATAVTRAAGGSTPVAIRIDDSFEGVSGNLHRKHVETCLAADSVITNSEPVSDRLAGVEQMPVATVVRDGLRVPGSSGNPGPARLHAIRSALTEAHPVLRIEKGQPLVVSCVRMNRECGLDELVRAWPDVLARFPGAKLWLIGDGSQAGRIWQRIVQLELAYSIIMPGYFDDLSNIMLAADLYVHPCLASHTGEGLLIAMSAGLAPIATRNQWTASLIDDGVNGVLLRSGSPAVIAEEILRGLADRPRLDQLGRLASATIAEYFSPRKQVEEYIEQLTMPTRQVVAAVK